MILQGNTLNRNKALNGIGIKLDEASGDGKKYSWF